MATQRDPGLDEIQQRLGALERAVAAVPPGRPRHATGIRVSDWFLPTALAWRLVLAPRAGLGPMLAFGRGRLARALATRRRHPWRLAADALAMNKNFRLFFLGAGVTVKARFSGPGGDDPISREIGVRQRARSTGAVGIPEMLDHGQAAGASYLAERLIADGARIDPAGGGEALAEALFDFYAANGLAVRPLAEAAQPPGWHDEIGAALAAAGTATGAIEAVRDGLDRLLVEAAGRPVLWGVCHGDLSLGNMLRAGGRIYLLDWEEAHEGPIYGDLAKLVDSLPGFGPRFDALARNFCGPDAAIAAQNRLAEAALLLKLWRESRAGEARPAKRRRLEAAARRLVSACVPGTG